MSELRILTPIIDEKFILFVFTYFHYMSGESSSLFRKENINLWPKGDEDVS